ncbi:terminase [Alloscardovia macacae]|uniref:Terminase n=1 Tax=Alloscardovia macacae TaxID=1160091 RepID=A0A261F1Z8_9BIFI|nr:terminase [Alloscardovia macacae]OZG53093.1 terminase [Alloscardovia macacae]
MMGRQSPTFLLAPRVAVDSFGSDVADLSAAYGMPLDEWQELVADQWLRIDDMGMWMCADWAISVPRQNGKNGVVEAVELYLTTVMGLNVLHTAHEVKTCRKHFLRMCKFFEDPDHYPDLAAMVSAIRRTNGQEAIILTNGASIEFIARTKNGGRGFTVDVIVYDEAQELTDEQMEAITPASASAPHGQAISVYMGTPTPPTSQGTVFERLHRKAHSDTPPTDLCWVEWSVDKVGDIHDQTRWYETNPALGGRLLVKSVESEVTKFSDEGFARERLGFWESITHTATDMDVEAWNECATDNPQASGNVGYAVKFAPDGSRVSLVACVQSKKGAGQPIHVEFVEWRTLRRGTSWLAEWLTQRWNDSIGIVIDGTAGSATLKDQLHDNGVPARIIREPKAADMIAAVSMFENAINEHTLTHFNQQQINDAVAHAKQRKLGSGHAYQSSDLSIDVSILEACALAYWLAKTSRRDPSRKQRIHAW